MKMSNEYTKENIRKYKNVKETCEKKNFNIIEIDGKKISDKHDIFHLFADKLSFPDYFGNNWDAFFDCLKDLSWLENKNCVVLIKNIEKIEDRKLKETLIEVLYDVQKFWKSEEISFDLIVFYK